MRLKLCENLTFSSHVEAIRQRDLSGAPDLLIQTEEPVNLPISMTSEEVFSDDELQSPNNEEEEELEKEATAEARCSQLTVYNEFVGFYYMIFCWHFHQL